MEIRIHRETVKCNSREILVETEKIPEKSLIKAKSRELIPEMSSEKNFAKINSRKKIFP